MAKKSSILKKLNPILKEAETLKNKKDYSEAVRKYREGINFLRLKATDMEGREEEVNDINDKINKVFSTEIIDIINKSNKLTDSKNFSDSITELNKALNVADNINDDKLKNLEVDKIKFEIKKVELKKQIEHGVEKNNTQEFDSAIEIFQKALKNANELFSSEVDNPEIKHIKDLFNQSYLEKVNLKKVQGSQNRTTGHLDNAINNYEEALKLTENLFDSEKKNKEISNIKEDINQTLSEKVKPILEKAKQLIDNDNKENAIDELENAKVIAKSLFDSPNKNELLSAIGKLINPLYLEKIKTIKQKGIDITEQEQYQTSVTTVIEAATIFHQALELVNKMIDSPEKVNELENIKTTINQTCSSGIDLRENDGLKYIDEKKYEAAISEMYSALSMAKNMACEEDQNVEIENIKTYINKVYSAQIEDEIEKGKKLLVEKKFEEAREIFNEAMGISNKMYVSEEMEIEVAKIKNLSYQTEMKQVISDGYLSEEQNKFEKQLEELLKELEKANLITDAERRRKKINDVKHQIDSVYSNQIKLLIEQGNLSAEKDNITDSIKQIDNALIFIDLIEYTVMKDNELRDLIKATCQYGNNIASKMKFDKAYELYDKGLNISEKIKDKDIKSEEIDRVKLLYEKELDNKVKKDLDNGDFDIAIKYCEKAINLDQNYAESYHNLGNAYIYKGEYDKAIDNFKKAINLNSNHIDAWNDMGLAYKLKEEFNEALNSLNKAIEIDSKNIIAWYRKGNVHKHKNESNQAIDSYKKVTELDPNHSKAWLFMGSLYFENKQYGEAIQYIEKAIELDSDIANQIKPLINDLKKLIESIQEKLGLLFKNK